MITIAAGEKGERSGMDKLTSKRVNGIRQGYWSPAKKEDLCQRLGAYEETWLAPEEIERLKRGEIVEVLGRKRCMMILHDAEKEQPDMSKQDWVLGLVNGIYSLPDRNLAFVDCWQLVSYDSETGWWLEEHPEIPNVQVSWWAEMPPNPAEAEK